MTGNGGERRAVYEARAARFTGMQREAAARSRRLSHFRLGTFAVLLAAAVWATERGSAVAWLLTGAAALVFVALVVLHARTRRLERRASALRNLAEQGIARLDRAWERLPVWAAPADLAEHPYGNDLDLFGHGSLTQLFGEPGSPQGRARLTAWLLEPAPPEETRARQDAVRELSGRIDYRDELALRAHPLRHVRADDVDAFITWCEETRSSPRSWLHVASLLIPLALWLSALPRLAGIWTSDVWVLPALASLAVTFGAPGRRARRTFARVFRREPLFRHVPDLLAHVAETDYAAPRLQHVRQTLLQSGASPRRELDRLRRISHLSDLRRSMLYFPIQLLTLWDLHVLRRLQGWRNRNGRSVRGWLDAAADVEALCALATLAHDHPQWCYPTVAPGVDRIDAAALGHPLLPPAARIDNDVVVGPRGTFLLVTGSNMSGKSTLLRALGTNLVLARAGAPVCAGSLVIPVAVPCVSMRVQDSLARGVSFFMAELSRMRRIVALAESAAREHWTCVFLLDELLHGTNSAERRIAARTVIERLVRVGAIGAVSTHDLQLGAEAALRDLAVSVHFTEHVRQENGRPAMTFDYRLRPGDATSTNALVLLELMGLGESA